MKKLLVLSIFLIPVLIWAGDETVSIKHVEDAQVKIAGFTLKSDKTVTIEALGAGGNKEIKRLHNFQQDPFNMFAYAWIIDAHSRKMVWRMTIDNTKRDWWDKWNRAFKGEVFLKKGEYELYYSAVKPDINNGFLSFERLLDMIFGDDDWWDDQVRKWYVRVKGVDAVLSEGAVLKYQRAYQDKAIVALTEMGSREYEKRGFSLKKRLKVAVYALGEGWEDEMFDYGWIVDMDSRKKIWRMRESRTRHAGGAIKNRVIRDEITLEPGNYMVYYRSDNNHCSDDWNANPPYDPNFWGITLNAAGDKFDPSIVTEYAAEILEPVLQIIRMGDSAYREKGLVVREDGRFRIFALGEGRGGEMYDYGWITEAKTGREVWRMRYRDTQPAGGSYKNRLFDGIVELPAGEYIVHYRTDDSHSYEEWNSPAPDDGKMWGITIYPLKKGQKAQTSDVKSLVPETIIAELTRVRDDEHLRKSFEIKKRTRVRIVALGEGDWDEMYDFGWIVNNETKRKVWRMRYRNTDNAGGASKNRKVDTVITLEPGSYTVHYITDDSHSYRDWNASPPDNPKMWGITLYKIGD
ncbi:MAG TPA: hypothetical protein ENJ10_11665 [Caldithrix abyssi]|uniref:Uncharacterized protein n=1 Tax=Caldithrix abyssi TaxID=187145 RepID=A0A7V1PVF5_CALAY|nr:hypothetical protein [Caldithrix abyssi]